MKIEPAAAPPPIRGFRFSGVHGGIKKKGRRDFALIVADRPCAAAAVFTQNACAAAPVVVAREHVAPGRLQAIMVNSGNANCATGEQGMKIARWSCDELAARLGIDPHLVLPCSTGVIGVPLDRRVMARAIALGVDQLSRRGFGAAARAILTSDAFPKWASRTLHLGGSEIQVAAMAKGAGMIEPKMATMLSFVLTDAKLSPAAAASMLKAGVARSLNRISVDGDTSTNDTCVLMASGDAAGDAIEGEESEGYQAVAGAVAEVLEEVARMIVRDGEGATKMIDLVVAGAADDAQADHVARKVVNSPLVRCALTGADPNWGRLVMALGNTGVAIDLSVLSVDVADVPLVRNGVVLSEDALNAARKVMKREAYTMTLRLGDGPGTATMITSDLTEEYVRFNSAYTS
ncbi:MAG TPA: bifunctional glutamate N-acetyltransferase/amino-acid acetyltransferase ArgJ [Candidatus Limnocylindrales bacterium]|nr:bifunctional glutamate N-acetyltransferase/amino-acid acetyltransferase ArgJ [Candidatus Limnocylindrales bacterium]